MIAGDPSNNLIEQVEGRGTCNVDVPIVFSNNSSEFQALLQEIKSQRVIMTIIMEEMKQQFQSILENFREKGQLSLKDNFLMN